MPNSDLIGPHLWVDCACRADYASAAEHDRDCPALDEPFDPDQLIGPDDILPTGVTRPQSESDGEV